MSLAAPCLAALLTGLAAGGCVLGKNSSQTNGVSGGASGGATGAGRSGDGSAGGSTGGSAGATAGGIGTGGGVDPYALRAPAAGDIFIDAAAGDDANPGSQGAPKKNLTAALLQSLSAGAVLWLKNGSYPAVDVRTLPSGSEGAPISIAAYPGHTPTLTFAAGGAVIGGGDYWDVRGLRFEVYDTGYMLGNAIGSGAEAPARHWRFIDCVGEKSFSGYTDNSGIIMADNKADLIEIIRGRYTGAGSTVVSNSSGLWFDYQKHLKIIGARIDNFELPIYFKHYDGAPPADVDIQIKNNVISRAHRYLALAANYVVFENNLVVACVVYPSERGGGVDGGNECTFRHNTFFSSNVSLAAEAGLNAQNVFRDNVFANAALEDSPYADKDDETDTDYNVFGPGDAVYLRNHQPYSLAGYRGAYPGKEVHSVAGAIVFAGGAAPSTDVVGDWALDQASAGKGSASDGKDAGVDVTRLLTAP